MTVFACLILLVCLCGCHSATTNSSGFEECRIDFSECEQLHWSELPDSILGKKQYIVLDTTNAECDFRQMSKVLLDDRYIYILDAYLKKLVVYDYEGNGIARIGNRGEGPQEYLDISDFDVAPDGTLYFIDGQLNKLFCFDKEFRFLYNKPLPFETDVLTVVDKGILWGLSSWNKKECEGYKVVRTDRDIHVTDSLLTYDEYVDPSFWISYYSFIRSRDNISYNQPIDNHIYLFDNLGQLKSCIYIDFGKQNVPDEVKKDVETNLAFFDRYCMLKNYTVVTDKVIAGTLLKANKTVPFILDRIGNRCYYDTPREDLDNSRTAGFSNSFWISYYEPDTEIDEELPDSVLHNLENGCFILCLQTLGCIR